MGNSRSNEVLAKELLEEYTQLTYLNKTEIRRLFQLLDALEPGKLKENFHHRFTKRQIEKVLPQIYHSPFRDMIYQVFSSERDECLSFEDTLDLCSAFSENCPENVRAAWAFQIFDFDGDNQVSLDDLIEAVQKLTRFNENGQLGIDRQGAEQVARMVLEEMDLTRGGSIDPQEFIRLVVRMPDFRYVFQFKL